MIPKAKTENLSKCEITIRCDRCQIGKVYSRLWTQMEAGRSNGKNYAKDNIWQFLHMKVRPDAVGLSDLVQDLSHFGLDIRWTTSESEL